LTFLSTLLLLAFLFLLLLLLGLFFLGFLGVVVGLSHVLTEGDLTEGALARAHLQNEHRVPRQVLQGAVSCLFVQNKLVTTGKSAHEKCICNRHRVANEEVAKGQMGVKSGKRLLELSQAHRE
jgi:hypothetical protein